MMGTKTSQEPEKKENIVGPTSKKSSFSPLLFPSGTQGNEVFGFDVSDEEMLSESSLEEIEAHLVVSSDTDCLDEQQRYSEEQQGALPRTPYLPDKVCNLALLSF